jgi:magnesium chelatase family protein
MLAIINSGTLSGVTALPVHVEISLLEEGDYKCTIVGLPDTAVRESSQRVASAIQNSGLNLPFCRYTVNLAPGSLRKEGPLYDLPIALGVLAASGQIKGGEALGFLARTLVAGELGLSGKVRPIRGGLALALLARERGFTRMILPRETALEANLIKGIKVIPVDSLDQAVRLIAGEVIEGADLSSTLNNLARNQPTESPDFSEVKGQLAVRRAVEVAVAGGHNILFVGPPGSGKSMVAKRIPSILPPPTEEEYLEILSIYSAAGLLRPHMLFQRQRPFRSPHHTISDVGLIGGGSIPGPGELSLAHQGVLFLDELPEFKRSVLEVMRQPLEDGEVTISRSAAKVTFPAQVMLVAAMNPTPSGFAEGNGAERFNSAAQIQKYKSRISGPLLDRIDVQVEAPALRFAEMHEERQGEGSAAIRERISAARQIQSERFGPKSSVQLNAHMNGSHLRQFVQLAPPLLNLLEKAMERFSLSARAHDKILRVARTIADLDGAETVQANHLSEAIGYRSLDRGTSASPGSNGKSALLPRRRVPVRPVTDVGD